MAVIVNGHKFVTLDDAFYINGARVVEARLGDGRLVYPRDKKPYGIKIVRPPYRKLYEPGDDLVFDGIAVVLLNKDGTVFEDERYPNGVIPFDELIFPVKTADGRAIYAAYGEADGHVLYKTSEYVYQYISSPIMVVGITDTITVNNDTLSFTEPISQWGLYFVHYILNGAVSQSRWAVDAFPYYLKIGVYEIDESEWSKASYYLSSIPGSTSGSQFMQPPFQTVDAMRYASPIEPSVPVQWESPYDGQVFEDSFEIKV